MRPRTRAEWIVLAGLAVWSLVPLAILLVHSLTGGDEGTYLGADGIQIGDQLAYLAWVRDSGDHGLTSNRFDSPADPHLFLHPMWIVSGLGWKLGASLQVAFLAWKPIAVVTLFAGFAAYVRRHLPAGPARSAALVAALFYFSPAAWAIDWAGVLEGQRFPSLGMALELFPAGLVWGVLPTAITLGLMPLLLVGVERVLDDGAPARPRTLAGLAAAGALVSWLHPWQGLTVLGIMAGVWAWSRFDARTLRALLAPAAGAAAPLAYYAVLSRTDSAWSFVSEPNDMPHFGWWLAAALVPPLALAATGLRGRADTAGERILRLWVPVALVVYLALQSSFFYHALAGLSLPCAVLAARGLATFRPPRAAVAALVALLTVPGLAFAVDVFTRDLDGHFLTTEESAAFDHLRASDRPGPVLARLELGRALPAHADRNTWVGHATWTPRSDERDARVRDLMRGGLARSEARALARESGAAFVLAGCDSGRVLVAEALGPLVRSVHRFGCATVYELEPGR
jgi:hypothetical protein